MNSPKILFQRTESVKKLAAAISEPWFQEALTAAFAHMAFTQPKGDNVALAWDAHNRLVGARDFIWKLTFLHLVDKEPEPESKSARSGLDYSQPPSLSQKTQPVK